jgi:hypothetical protein
MGFKYLSSRRLNDLLGDGEEAGDLLAGEASSAGFDFLVRRDDLKGEPHRHASQFDQEGSAASGRPGGVGLFGDPAEGALNLGLHGASDDRGSLAGDFLEELVLPAAQGGGLAVVKVAVPEGAIDAHGHAGGDGFEHGFGLVCAGRGGLRRMACGARRTILLAEELPQPPEEDGGPDDIRHPKLSCWA